VPPLFIGGFVVAVGAATITLIGDPSAAPDTLAPVLLLQVFAASSGFRHPARRGHYDLLLTSGTPRWQIALAHCVSSIAPGLAAWLAVGIVELVMSHGTRLSSIAEGTCITFLAMSFIAWAVALPLSRATSAVAWLLVMTIRPLSQAVNPSTLVSAGSPRPDFVLAALTGSAIVLTVAAFVLIARTTVPLEASQ